MEDNRTTDRRWLGRRWLIPLWILVGVMQGGGAVSSSLMHILVSGSANQAATCSMVDEQKGGKSLDFGSGECVDGNGTCAPIYFVRAPRQMSPVRFAVRRASTKKSICSRAELPNSPDWVTTAFWIEPYTKLGLLNGVKGTLAVYINESGSWRRRGDQPSSLPLIEGAAPYGNNIIGKLKSRTIANRFFVISRQLAIRRQLDIKQLGSLYVNWALVGDTIIGYGSIVEAGRENDAERPFTLGVVRIDLRHRIAHMVEPLGADDYYRFNHQYVAGDRDRIYYLALNKAVRLRRWSAAGLEEVDAMPEGYRQVPAVPRAERSADALWVFKWIEEQKLPIGVYAQGGFVYLLLRDPLGDETPWRLYKLDPVAERVIGSVPVPSLARHLSLVPGEHDWLLIERGAVEGLGSQHIDAITAMPEAWLTSPKGSPLQKRENLRECVRGNY